MPQALPLPDKLAPDISRGIADTVLAAKFGNGYEQRAPSGINASADTWTISWVWLQAADRDTVLAALNAVGVWDYLTWTPIGESVQKSFKVTPNSRRVEYYGGKTKISCALEQVF